MIPHEGYVPLASREQYESRSGVSGFVLSFSFVVVVL